MTDTTITTCPRHPKVETELRCASCGEPICPKCMVYTPVGAKCRECGTARGSRLFTLTPLQTAVAAGVGLLAGAIAGWAVEFHIGIFFSLFLSFIYGGFVGDMIMRVAGRKRGVRMELLAGASLVFGALLGRTGVALLLAAVNPSPGAIRMIVDLAVPSPIPLVLLVIVVASAVSRIRYV